MRTALNDIREAAERVNNSSVKVSRRDIMLVAWASFKSYKRSGIDKSFAQCLRNVWKAVRENMHAFLVELHDIVLAKRKETLKNFDVLSAFRGTKNGTYAEVSFRGKWWQPYEWLFKLKVK